MFSKKTIIRYSESDATGRLSMEGLLCLFQDVGYQHALDRGYGDAYSKKTGHTWYLLSWKIDGLLMPKVGEEVTIETWFYEIKGATAKKNIVMKDKAGELLAQADTLWVYMDTDTQEAATVSEGMWPESDHGEELPMPSVSRRIQRPDPKELTELPATKAGIPLMDTNHHANNVKLTLFAMSLAGADYGCRNLRAEFKNQVPVDTPLYPRIGRKEGEIFCALQDGEGRDYACFLFSVIQ